MAQVEEQRRTNCVTPKSRRWRSPPISPSHQAEKVDPMNGHGTIQRTILPIPDRSYVGLTTYDAKDPDTSFPPIQPLRPPEGAPNVLVVLLDDVGFAASSAFGGVISTPTAERLAES